VEDRIKLLIAVGASVTANCRPCLKTAVTGAQGAGVDKKEIIEAIAIGRVVRKGSQKGCGWQDGQVCLDLDWKECGRFG
jgi:AhpD family alkylhydroperoxidase